MKRSIRLMRKNNHLHKRLPERLKHKYLCFSQFEIVTHLKIFKSLFVYLNGGFSHLIYYVRKRVNED